MNRTSAGKRADYERRITLFVKKYIECTDAGIAYVAAGFTARNSDVAKANGYRFLQRDDVQAVLETERGIVSKKLDISVERVLKEAARIAFFDPRKLLDEHGNMRQLSMLDADTAAGVAAFDFVSSESGKQITKIRLADKNSSLEKLMRYLGLFEKDRSKTSEPVVIRNHIDLGGPNGGRLRAGKEK